MMPVSHASSSSRLPDVMHAEFKFNEFSVRQCVTAAAPRQPPGSGPAGPGLQVAAMHIVVKIHVVHQSTKEIQHLLPRLEYDHFVNATVNRLSTACSVLTRVGHSVMDRSQLLWIQTSSWPICHGFLCCSPEPPVTTYRLAGLKLNPKHHSVNFFSAV